MRTVRTLILAAMLVLPVASCGRSTPSATPTTSPPATTSTSTTPPPASTAPATPPPPTTPGPHPTTAHPPATTSSRPAPTTTGPTATPPFPPSLLGKDVERILTSTKIIALTFDAGANADGVASILATLARERVTATFFLTGDFVGDFPGQVRQIAGAGHRLGNHSIDHPYFTDLTDAKIRAQVLGAATIIRNTTGISPAPLFRFPYGDRDVRTIAAVNAAGYVPVRWTVDSLGWQGTMNGARTALFVSDRVLGAAAPGAIVAMHVGSNPTDHSTLDADALPAIISGLRARGYSFVTLNALLT
jgi:peptidoglycan/xylan/chitin deacetylase (PgdA/CDA1 family)